MTQNPPPFGACRFESGLGHSKQGLTPLYRAIDSGDDERGPPLGPLFRLFGLTSRRGKVVRELRDAFAQIRLRRDVVAVEDAPRLVAGQLHGDALGDAGAHEIPHCGTTEVVHDSSDQLWPDDFRDRLR
jgi:hypothetical protein